MFVLTDTEEAALPAVQEPDVPQTIGGVAGFSSKNEKLKNLGILLAAKKNNKVLIFSGYDSSFDTIIPILQKEGISFDYLKGNGHHINNVIDKYKNGNVNVLLVNTRYYGSGFNMENTSDIIMFHKFDTQIEKQVIGRAQRFGRTEPLNVWYVLYENECASEESV
jgi:SNF2 family DNA or RNA helicase